MHQGPAKNFLLCSVSRAISRKLPISDQKQQHIEHERECLSSGLFHWSVFWVVLHATRMVVFSSCGLLCFLCIFMFSMVFAQQQCVAHPRRITRDFHKDFFHSKHQNTFNSGVKWALRQFESIKTKSTDDAHTHTQKITSPSKRIDRRQFMSLSLPSMIT